MGIYVTVPKHLEIGLYRINCTVESNLTLMSQNEFLVVDIHGTNINVTTYDFQHVVKIHGKGFLQNSVDLFCVYKDTEVRLIPTSIDKTFEEINCTIPKVTKSMQTELRLAFMSNGSEAEQFNVNYHSVFAAFIDRGINVPYVLNNASFEQSLTSVNVQFDGPIQLNNPNIKCNNLFPMHYQKFGRTSKCFIKNSNILVIELNRSPSLVSEHLQLNLKALKYKSAYLTIYPNVNQTFFVRTPYPEVPPKIFIKGPSIACKLICNL